MIKRLSKKGQSEGTGLGTILAMVAGVVALILIIIGFTGGFGQIFGSFDLLPNDLTKMSAACKTYSEQEALRLSYCQFNEGRIEGTKGFYNCDYVHNVSSQVLGADKVGWNKLNGACSPEVSKNYCMNLKETQGENYKPETIVNGNTCEALLVP